ncbi:NHL domain-containing protein [Pinibacter aurantiacus]|uniref:Gliding motility-associated C-terminal domain-containing protein n=1 Tax=Pinibacter aurantiacus TaxID=2851599 RepID=A0A9E2SBN2_9BACT|nr:gliding motility-associated C-terminal domain-containing protein [Pinibacter aurantiacus]MBV4360098.1 gliding motility-associated C-terminal domain-containing protein [Pinibacter aurantiacus]
MHRIRACQLLLILFMSYSSQSQIITTFAGNGGVGYSGENGPATQAALRGLNNICIDKDGNVYITDLDNYSVRKINTSGVITTFAGTGTRGFSGDGGPAANAGLDYPSGLCADNNGNIYITDGSRIRKVNSAGIITTIAGTGVSGNSGDGGPALNAQFYSPDGMCIDKAGNIYFADFANQNVRKISTSGIISTVAGNGVLGYWGDGGLATAASLNSPTDVAVDNDGNIYIADMGNSVIRKVDNNGIITTIVKGFGYSGDGGPSENAKVYYPYDLYIDGDGNIYISDTRNKVIRKIDKSGTITTFAGTGAPGNSGDGGPALQATFQTPGPICGDAAGNIYVCDPYNRVVRKIGTCDLISFSQNPTDIDICAVSGNANFIALSGNANIYQWQVNTGTGWSDINDDNIYSGAKTNKLSISNAQQSMSNFQYRCSLSNNCATIYSTAALLTLKNPVTAQIAINTSFSNICKGALATFNTATVNGGLQPAYQWKKNGALVGTNASTYSDNTLADKDIITCELTSNESCVIAPTVSSKAITMTVNDMVAPTVSITSSASNICAGTPVTFTAAFSNGGNNPAFTWFKNTQNLFLNAPVYTDNTLKDGDVIRCAFQSSMACVTSDLVISNQLSLGVTSPRTPSVTIVSSSNEICKGALVTFTAVTENGGNSPAFSWTRNDQPVGTNTISYTAHNLTAQDVIKCTLTSNESCITQSMVNSGPAIVSIRPDPIIALDHTSTLCKGEVRTLDAGDYPSVQWNNGSTSRTINVNNIGTYSVTVTDEYGCKNSDATNITTINPSPSNFLPKDTDICGYEKLSLSATSKFNSYLWSDGSTSSTIIIAHPGSYSLKVTDNNGCTGNSTIVVGLKDCLEGFFMPNAFTPNGDGKNDLLKPVLLGAISAYRFCVYNRWGQLVFQTSAPGQGWDGSINGLLQNGGTFIWACTYQLEGGVPQYKKGTAVLIR